ELRGRRVHVFSFRIDEEHSQYTLNWKALLRRYRGVFGFRGIMYLDTETYQVLRLTHSPERIPQDWPINGLYGELDYGFAEIAGEKTFVPLRAEMLIETRDGNNRNVIEFANYRKFSTEATLKFE